MKRRDAAAWPARAATALAMATIGLLGGAGAASAHGGDADLVHGCIVPVGGTLKIVAADGTCAKNDIPLDWPAVDMAGASYSAGTGLTLSAENVFSVSSVPWDVLTDIPAELADGDDDGSAKIGQLRGDLAADDGVPGEAADLVSFSKLKDLVSSSGDGRITGAHIRDGSVRRDDIDDGTITASKLAGSDDEVVVPGAVTSEKILDGTIQSRDLASGVLDRTVTTLSVDPPAILPGSRLALTVTLPVQPQDLVTASPPALLEHSLLFVGSDVTTPGELTIYLYNAAATTIDGSALTWTVRQLHVGG